jgi:hypothetical protein
VSKKDASQNELNQFVPAGLKWLYEMEAVNSPVLLNNLYGNIYSFPNVADAEILLDRYNKRMLIYVKFTWFVRKYWKSRKKLVTISILDQLQELLPSFEFRIIEDKALFDLAVQRMRESILGGNNENDNKPNDGNTDDATASSGPSSLAINNPSDSNSSTEKTSETTEETVSSEVGPEALGADKKESSES